MLRSFSPTSVHRWLILATVCGCADPLADTTSRVDAPRVLAIRTTPAEALPNQLVHLEALYADATGALAIAPIRQTFCTARKPLAELGPVSRECLDPESDELVLLGDGREVDGRLPREVCQLFGPNPPAAQPGEPNGRPVDPDATGGYYQPVLVFRTDDPTLDPTVSAVRVLCGLASAPTDAVTEFNTRYRRNENPTFDAVELLEGGVTVAVPEDGAGVPPRVMAGSSVSFTVRWPACPTTDVCGDGICSIDETRTSCVADCTTPVGCGGSERYLVYDSAVRELSVRREAMRVAWYATRGAWDVPRTGRASDDPERGSDNVFVAPSEAGEVVIYLVLRDDRGGTAFAAHRLDVVP